MKIGTRNLKTLNEKELELVEEFKKVNTALTGKKKRVRGGRDRRTCDNVLRGSKPFNCTSWSRLHTEKGTWSALILYGSNENETKEEKDNSFGKWPRVYLTAQNFLIL